MTEDINFKGMLMAFKNNIFKNNSLEKGYMFEFKHNFRLATFINCSFTQNKGSIIE